MKKRMVLVLSLLIFLAGRADSFDFAASPGTIPREYFGLHIHRAATTTPFPAIPFGSWRLWDAAVSWSNLEPVPGKWNFEKLDKLVSLAEARKVDVLLTLGLTPPWASARPTESSVYGPGLAAAPKAINDWKRYVETVARRYKGRIHGYEIWNEPNLMKFYSGTPGEMVSLAREAYGILKAIDPNALVVSPSATTKKGLGWLKEFFSLGGGKYCDVIGYHLYVTPSPPEEMSLLMSELKVLIRSHGLEAKPIWNTEAGWAIRSKIPSEGSEKSGRKEGGLGEEEAAAYVARAYIVNWASGVDRYYFYAWDNKEMGLVEPDGKTLKPAAVAYKAISDWMVGATMKSCRSTKEGTWICELVRDNGYLGWILWHPSRKGSYPYSKSWKIVQARKLDGTRRDMTSANAVEIGPAPVLVENQAR